MGVSKVEFGNEVLLDLTADTVSASTLVAGVTAHNAAGELISGELQLPLVAANGGTGRNELTAGSYLVGNGTGEVVLKTPEEVLTDIGALKAGTKYMYAKYNEGDGKTYVYSDEAYTTLIDDSYVEAYKNGTPIVLIYDEFNQVRITRIGEYEGAVHYLSGFDTGLMLGDGEPGIQYEYYSIDYETKTVYQNDAYSASMYDTGKVRIYELSAPVAAWASDATYTDFPYAASVAATVDDNYFVDVYFSGADASSGNFAPFCEVSNSVLKIFAREMPTSDVSFKIKVWIPG